MSSTIIINSTHFDTTSNNKFVYRFPSNVKFSKGSSVALQSFTINNTFYNIENARNNNTISIIWNANTSERYDFIIPDGYYTVERLNEYLHKQCKLNGVYMTNSKGSPIYLFQFYMSPTSNDCVLNVGSIPKAEDAELLEYFTPNNAKWEFPAEEKSIQIVIGSKAFGDLLGFEEGTYPAEVLATKCKFRSSFPTNIHTIHSLILTCNLISSKYSNPINVFCTIPVSGKFGSTMHFTQVSLKNTIPEGYYNNIVIEFLDHNFNKGHLRDPEVIMTLSINDE
jgi:hypothetical protein